MTRAEISKAFEAVMGMEPRMADVAVIELLGGSPEEMAEYLWDHWMGEPEDVEIEDILFKIKEAIKP